MTIMESRWGLYSLFSAYLLAVCLALPSSLVEEIKNSEVKSNKVKRAQSGHNGPEENIGRMSYFNNRPTSAIKRGTNLKEADLGDWTGVEPLFRGSDFTMDNVQSGLFGAPNQPLGDDKSIAEYEKGYRYGTNKDKLDEALENAVLKSELYGDPYSQYRYYGADDRRRRRDVSSNKQRPKRNIDLTPDEVLALLTLYENNHRALKDSDNNYRQPVMRYNKNYDPYEFDVDSNDETWLNAPVYPHASLDQLPENYLFDYPNQQPQPDYKPRWGSVEDAKKKRYFVSKKRTSDPTRMIRYINGPSQNDFNTLSSIINNQKEPKPEIPVMRRLIL